jgi:alpha-amylase
MPSICLYFQLHQPYRTRAYDFIQIGNTHDYFDEQMNRFFLDQVCNNSYLPATALLKRLVDRYGKDFQWAFSATGTTLDQLEKYRPDVLEKFQELSQNGCVEWLSETSSHSLASLYQPEEFKLQLLEHGALIKRLFSSKPSTFRNTELLFSNDLVNTLTRLGYYQYLVPSTELLPGNMNPNHVYRSPMHNKAVCLPKNSSLTAEITRWFGQHDRPNQPLDVDRFLAIIDSWEDAPESINLFMDFETLGEHKHASTGIFEFFEAFPEKWLGLAKTDFAKPATICKRYTPVGKYDLPYPITWSHPSYDLSYITGSDIQQEAMLRLYDLTEKIYQKNDAQLLSDWRNLQATDHFFYMTPRFEARGERNYYSPFSSAYEAYNNYLNILIDLELRANR